MDNKDGEFLKRIRTTFRIEAEEHLRAFSAGLIELEKTRTKKRISEIIESIYREIHSLKGAARSVDQKEIESVCHPLESLFSALKRDEIALTPVLFDILNKAAERLSKLLSAGGLIQSSTDRQIQRELICQLKEISVGAIVSPAADEPKHVEEIKTNETVMTSGPGNKINSDLPKGSAPLSLGVVRIPISKLDSLLLQAEEMIQTKKTLDQNIKELKEINTNIKEWKSDLSDQKGHRSAMSVKLWDEWLEGNEAKLNRLENKFTELTHSMIRDQYILNRMVNDQLEEMKNVLLLPVSSLVESFPVMVREISREQGKKIEFIIRGAELEIDKRILEELKDPLIHLIRNSIDHGIGKPAERVSQNRPSHGTIILVFEARESGMIEITLSDDGKGINTELVVKSAVKTGIISREEAEKLDPQETLSLIYQSGVTTSSIITDISGRGLGLSIVREKVEKLSGKISVETAINSGTTFHILMPMTLSTFRAVLVRIGEFMFVLPTMNVERVVKVDPSEIKTVENHDTIRIDDRILSVEDLGEVLGLPEHKHTDQADMEMDTGYSNKIRMVILVSGENQIAFKVDEVVDEQQVLVKGLGKLLKRVRNISGATVLGSGKVVPIIHVADLMKSALRPAIKVKGQFPEEAKSEKIKKILVAEDSVTARTLLKNILETAGYMVTTAIDGTDAFTRARANELDLIISDIDMPRMNGFELTSKIRNDKKLNELPVVLVTALESREDREHGIEVGADAYIVKSSFDQTNLLEIIKKLI